MSFRKNGCASKLSIHSKYGRDDNEHLPQHLSAELIPFGADVDIKISLMGQVSRENFPQSYDGYEVPEPCPTHTYLNNFHFILCIIIHNPIFLSSHRVFV